jgi:DNA-binding transcriptional LysR family regulator
MGLELTPTGYELLAHVKAMGSAASSFSLSVAGKSEALEGLVSISATETMATYGLPEVIDEFRGLYPGIKLELIPTHAASDLKRREADIAIRGFRPDQDDLIVRKLRTEKGRLYATPKYLKRIGNPTKPEDLSEAHFIGFDQSTGYM